MSFLSTALSAALADLNETQTSLAARAGLSGPHLSRAARGIHSVGIDTAEAISRALPEPHNATVLVGWLKDQLSADRAHLVEIHPVTTHLAEAPPLTLPQLDPDTERHIIWLAGMAARHTAVRDSIRALHAASQAIASE